MYVPFSRYSRFGRRPLLLAASISAVSVAIAMTGAAPADASAATPVVGLGTAAPYSVLGGQAVTNTGPTTLSGDLGVSPGTAITGFPPGIVGGSRHSADAAAGMAQADAAIAYNDAAGRASTQAVAGDLVGRTLNDGVYTSSGPLALSGTLTFDGQGDPSSVFIVQVASTLITATASHVLAINGAQACHIFWQVGSSATLGTASTFQGTILASASVTVTTSAHVKGRALARTGSVTLDNDVFTSPDCANTTPPAAAAATTTVVNLPPSATSGTSVVIGGTVTGTSGPITGTVGFYSNGVLIGTAPVNPSGHATITVPAGGLLTSGPVVAIYNGSPASAPSTSAPSTFVVTPAVVTTPRSSAAASAVVRSASSTTAAAFGSTSGATLAATGPRSALPLTGFGVGAVLLGLFLLVAARTRRATRRRF